MLQGCIIPVQKKHRKMECKIYSLHCSFWKTRMFLALLIGVILFVSIQINVQLYFNREKDSLHYANVVFHQRKSEKETVTTIRTTSIWKNKQVKNNPYLQQISEIDNEVVAKQNISKGSNSLNDIKRDRKPRQISGFFDTEQKPKKSKVRKIAFKEFENRYPLAVSIVALVKQYKETGKVPHKPINPYPYEVMASPDYKCKIGEEKQNEILLVFLVKSAMENFDRRKIIRETWGDEDHLEYANVKRVFLLGMPQNNRSLTRKIIAENEKYQDIVQINFLDGYYNNTLKTVGAINWVTSACSSAKYALFVDDDYFVASDALVSYIKTIPKKQARYLYMGFVNNQTPARRPVGEYAKWYIPYSEYPFTKYPPFVSAGAILMSMEFLTDVQIAIPYTQHFRFDDVFIGFVVYKLKVKPQQNDNFWVEKCTYTDPCFEEMLVSHEYTDPTEIRIAWELLQELRSWEEGDK